LDKRFRLLCISQQTASESNDSKRELKRKFLPFLTCDHESNYGRAQSFRNFGVYCDAVLSHLNTNQANEVVA